MGFRKTIGIVDDDDTLRDSLGVLLRVKGFNVREFCSGEELLATNGRPNLDCIILDLRMQGMSGLEVVETCRMQGLSVPIIIATAFGDVESTKRALKAGAFDFLEKPIREAQMLGVIADALAHREETQLVEQEQAEFEDSLTRLSARERQVLSAILAGRQNRHIASELNISVRTVEVYKARLMEKMGVSTIMELYRLVGRMHGSFLKTAPLDAGL